MKSVFSPRKTPRQALFHDSLVGPHLTVTTFPELRSSMRPRESTWPIWALWFLVAALACEAIAVRLWRVAATTQGPWQVVELVHDDAYYYLTVAANTIESGRTTLDGSTLTNGYQPMWFVLVTLLGLAIGTHAMSFFSGFIVMICVIILGSVLAGIPLGKSPNSKVRSALAIGSGLAAITWTDVFFRGMETVLLLPLVIPMVSLMEREPNRRTTLYLSGVFALAFLVRLDALALVPAYVLVVMFLDPLVSHRLCAPRTTDTVFRSGWRSQKWLFIIVGPVVMCYALINVAIYGVPVPVSGLAKGIGPHFENFAILSDYAHASGALYPLVICWAIVEALAFRAGVRSRHFLLSMAIFGLAGCLQAIYYAVASTWIFWPWYYYFLALLMVVIIARIVVLGCTLGAKGPCAGRRCVSSDTTFCGPQRVIHRPPQCIGRRHRADDSDCRG